MYNYFKYSINDNNNDNIYIVIKENKDNIQS